MATRTYVVLQQVDDQHLKLMGTADHSTARGAIKAVQQALGMAASETPWAATTLTGWQVVQPRVVQPPPVVRFEDVALPGSLLHVALAADEDPGSDDGAEGGDGE